jgi:hypothetical protein
MTGTEDLYHLTAFNIRRPLKHKDDRETLSLPKLVRTAWIGSACSLRDDRPSRQLLTEFALPVWLPQIKADNAK